MSLTLAATGVSMAGQFMQGKAAYTQAKYEQAAAKANATEAANQAKESTILTQQEAARRYREAADLEGQQTAAMAANNIDLGFGSAVSVQKDSKMIAAEDVGNIYAQGEQRTRGYLIDAYNYRLKGTAAKSAARGAQIGTGIGMLSTALGGASQISKMKAQANYGGG